MQLVYLRYGYLGAVPENILFANCGSTRSIHLQIIVADEEFRNSNRSYFEKYLKKVEKYLKKVEKYGKLN